MMGLLCESFTLSLQQIMTGLSSLQLSLHQSQRLPGWEDSFSVLFRGQRKLHEQSFDCLTPVPDIVRVFLVQVNIIKIN